MADKHLPGRHNQLDHADGASGVARRVVDRLGLTDRIDLDEGESLAGSAKVPGGGLSNADVVMALIHGPSGPRLRIAAVGLEDSRRWRAANRGGTAQLDAAGITALTHALDDVGDDGPDLAQRYRSHATEHTAQISGRVNEILAELDAIKAQQFPVRDPVLREQFDRLVDELHRVQEGEGLLAFDEMTVEGVVPGESWGDLA